MKYPLKMSYFWKLLNMTREIIKNLNVIAFLLKPTNKQRIKLSNWRSQSATWGQTKQFYNFTQFYFVYNFFFPAIKPKSWTCRNSYANETLVDFRELQHEAINQRKK